ncbi:hypothetical protein TVAG_244130 [Trichomonas vaginalis G3]|uniref:Bap-like n=1 Tax=Trichomonas vaginalis (strain ATCC PRA-98 / G3) TaxID=412133 RepID=A2G528_TRIV3|nr:ribonuclease H protein family [Trichomonas vaginalis G3]EAX87747.1 hypothetical protein TVAG_244130 [Trichomonas vaginalis G3]KAI5506745.1 ribonuclease H protein family [Trichomonas vaginalis G3]|eukprot:XP_001300677.1 hypothetical protein [Trichomonas vaginalis G3]
MFCSLLITSAFAIHNRTENITLKDDQTLVYSHLKNGSYLMPLYVKDIWPECENDTSITFCWYYLTRGNAWDFGYAKLPNGVQHPQKGQYCTDFDVLYRGAWTTFAKTGWWPIWSIDDSIYYRIHGSENGTNTLRNVTIRTKITQPAGPNYLLIEFIAHNHDSQPHIVNVLSYTDVMIGNKDSAPIKWYPPNTHNGFSMENEEANRTLVLIGKNGFGVNPVDYLWFGLYSEGQTYKFNKTDESPTPIGRDTAFSLGWTNRRIYPGQNLSFGVLLGIGEFNQLKFPPTITVDESKFKINYAPGEKIKIPIRVQDKLTGSYGLRVTCEFPNNESKTHNISKTEGTVNEPVEFEYDLGQNISRYPVKCYAENYDITKTDHPGPKSNDFNRVFLVNEAPRLTLTSQINDQYGRGGYVNIDGIVWDDTRVTMTYQVDDNFYYRADGDITCDKQEKLFSKQIQISPSYSYGKHTLQIWAEDEFGVKSPIVKKEFSVVQNHPPEVNITEVDDNKSGNYYNSPITFKLQVRDVDVDDVILLMVKTPGTNQFAQIMTTPAKQQEWINFTYTYDVEALHEEGNYAIIFQATDRIGSPSRNKEYTFIFKKHPVPTPAQPRSEKTDNSGNIEQCAMVTDANGDSFLNCTMTHVIIDVNQKTPSASNDDGDAFSNQGDANKSNSKKKDKYLIIGIAAAAVVAAAAIIAAILIAKEASKKANDFGFNPETEEALQANNDFVQEKENPVYNENAQDDPFANEFEDVD